MQNDRTGPDRETDMQEFAGVYPILATPFLDDERIDEESLRRMLAFMARTVGERRNYVERSKPSSGLLNPRSLRCDARPHAVEDLDLELETPLVGAEHLLLVLFERRRDEALAAGNRLLPVIVGRNAAEVRVRDLDVVPEHAVVADLERGDAGPGPLRVFHRGDVLLVAAADAAQLVELAVNAVADHATVPSDAGGSSTIVADLVAQIGEIVELGDQTAHKGACSSGRSAHARHRGDRVSQRDQVAGPAVPSDIRATSRSMS